MSAPSAAAQFALETAEGALGLLAGRERADAERLLSLCKERWQEAPETRRARAKTVVVLEASALVEVLARRSATAMPFAALGRALIADEKGDSAQVAALLAEFQSKLAQLGL